jgi:hypothetical protein
MNQPADGGTFYQAFPWRTFCVVFFPSTVVFVIAMWFLIDPNPSILTVAAGLAALIFGILAAQGAACAYDVFFKPVLFVRDNALTARNIHLPWSAIGGLSVRKGRIETFVGIDTTDNAQFLQRLAPLDRLRFSRNIRQAGSPILVPPIKGFSPGQLRALIENRRAAMLASQSSDSGVAEQSHESITIAPLSNALPEGQRWFFAFSIGVLFGGHSIWNFVHAPSAVTLLWAVAAFGIWGAITYFVDPFLYSQGMRAFYGPASRS